MLIPYLSKTKRTNAFILLLFLVLLFSSCLLDTNGDTTNDTADDKYYSSDNPKQCSTTNDTIIKHAKEKEQQYASNGNFIIVDKEKLVLSVIDCCGDTFFSAPCGLGKEKGNKGKVGDYRTPEGTFTIQSIVESSEWTHDFNDGEGEREGAYGDYFIRLKHPKFTGIGIHGTCFPESIGTRCSEGCIRLKNEDLLNLRTFCRKRMKVIITKDSI